jgi:ADP-heptose:LPS heptosyltransferase
MRILIIQTGLPGDALFSLPAIRALRSKPGNSVELIIRPGEHEQLLNQDGDFIIHRLDSWWSLAKTLAWKRYDVIVDFEPEPGSRFLTLILRGRVLRPALQPFGWKRRKVADGQHKVDKHVALIKHVTGDIQTPPLTLSIGYKDEVPPDWLPAGFENGYVAFCIGAPYPTRRLPMNRMIELCDKINARIILLGSRQFSADGEAIERFFERSIRVDVEEGLRALNKRAIVFNGCGKFNMLQQASIVKQARHVFTFDNEYIAIASAFERNTIVVLGNTVAGFGGYPYEVQFTVLENNKLDCRPCSTKGYAKCPLGHFKCMVEVSFDFYVQ